jgi:signal transduction histidine kinase
VHPVHRLVRTASFRFAALYVLVFAVSALVLGEAIFVAARANLEQQMALGVQTETTFLQDEFRQKGLPALLTLVQLRGREARALDYLVQQPRGVRLAGEIPANPGLRPGWTNLIVSGEREEDGRPERVKALVTDLGGGTLLAVGDDLNRVSEVEEAVTSALAWTVGLAAILGIGGGVLLSRAFLARVDAIARTAEAIIAGDLTHRVPMRGTGDDLDRLAGTLNRMLDRITTLMESLIQVSSDVAHDLRTPLSRLYQRLEDARDQARSVVDYEEAVEAAMREADGLLETFSALLRIAQVEGASPRAGFREVNLTAIVESVVDAYQPDAEDAAHRLTAQIEPGVIVAGDQELLTQAISNIVENALRHTPSGTDIDLRLHECGGDAVLVVDDNGPGVAEHDLPRLTNRFYRSERSRTTPGNGLGLSLVAAVTELHAGHLLLRNLAPGFSIALHLPRVVKSRPSGPEDA